MDGTALRTQIRFDRNAVFQRRLVVTLPSLGEQKAGYVFFTNEVLTFSSPVQALINEAQCR